MSTEIPKPVRDEDVLVWLQTVIFDPKQDALDRVHAGETLLAYYMKWRSNRGTAGAADGLVRDAIIATRTALLEIAVSENGETKARLSAARSGLL